MKHYRVERVYMDPDGNRTDEAHASQVLIRTYDMSGHLTDSRTEPVQGSVSLDQGSYQQPEIWYCPNDETANTGPVCVICGAPRPQEEPAQPQEPPIDVYPGPQPIGEPSGKKKKLLLILLPVGAVLLAALVAVMGYFLCWFGHDLSDPTCTSAPICSRCNTAHGSALGHSWSSATCTAAKSCTRCGKTEGSALGHNWSSASCTVAKSCSRCGKTEGSALGHSWKEATYSDPATCTRCGRTDGDPKLITGKWEKIRWGTWNSDAQILDTPLKDCRSLHLQFCPIFLYDTYISNWKMLYRDGNGRWIEYGSFDFNGRSEDWVLVEYYFSTPTEVTGFTVIPGVSGRYSYQFYLVAVSADAQ